MTDAFPHLNFDPVAVIGDTLATLFGPKNADRWPDCIAASRTDRPLTWHDVAAALVVWIAYADESAETAMNLRTVPISSVEAFTTWATSIVHLDPSGAAPGLDYVRPGALDAVLDTVFSETASALIQGITVWQGSDGRSALELKYADQTGSVKVTYGDALAPIPLLTVRYLGGEALRSIQRALVEATGFFDEVEDSSMARGDLCNEAA